MAGDGLVQAVRNLKRRRSGCYGQGHLEAVSARPPTTADRPEHSNASRIRSGLGRAITGQLGGSTASQVGFVMAGELLGGCELLGESQEVVSGRVEHCCVQRG